MLMFFAAYKCPFKRYTTRLDVIKIFRFLCLASALLAFTSTGWGQQVNIGPGVVNNTGSIEITAASNLVVASGGATLTGGGTVTLSGINSGITDVGGVQTLTIADQTIQGVGNIGRNTLDFDNQADGLIDANVDGETLLLDALTSFVNSGTLRASGGGILELRNAGTTDFANADGTIEAQDGSVVLLATSARIVGGVLDTFGSGQFRVAANQNAFLEDLTLNGSLVAVNGSETHISGTINNTGSIEITSTSGICAADLEIAGDNATLTGGGTVTLSGTNAGISQDAFAVRTLTIGDQTIQGVGNVGRSNVNFVNTADGLIDANVDGETLTIEPNSRFTNNGTLRASNGGILDLSDAGVIDNADGTIEAHDDSVILLSTGARIVDGVLATEGSGQFRITAAPNVRNFFPFANDQNSFSEDVFLEDLTLNGSLVAADGSETQISGMINNTGSIEITSTGGATDLLIASSGATLTGGGTVTLSGTNAGISDSNGFIFSVQTLTIGDQTIQGSGNIGRNTLNLVNTADGLIDANVDGETLVLDPSGGFTNNGTLRASSGGILVLRNAGGSDFDNVGGTIEALNGSEVLLTVSAGIVGGVLETDGSGQFRVAANQNAFLEDLTLNGRLVAEDRSNTQISGTINNTGSIEITSNGGETDLEIGTGGATLTGGGTVTLSGTNAGISDSVFGIQTLTIADQTIQGSGNIGRNTLNLINNGTILANDAAVQLTIDVNSANFDNDGTLQVSNGATLEVVGDLLGLSTSTLLGDGIITATGGDIQHDGLIVIGDDSIGSLTFDANLSLDSLAEIQFEIGGASAGTEFDVLTITDSTTLDGLLSLSLANGFTPDEDDIFEIIVASSLTGSFANVFDGGILQTADGRGEFTVNFGSGSSFNTNSVVLSSFAASAIPEPTSGSLLMLIGLAVMGRRRRNV